MSSRAIAIRSGVSCPGLGLTLVLGLLGSVVGCSDSSDDDADSPEATVTAGSVTTGGSSAGGSSAGGSSAGGSSAGGSSAGGSDGTANGTAAATTSVTSGSAGTGGGSAGTGGAGGVPDTTSTSDTGGTGGGSGGTGGGSGGGVACVAEGGFCRVAPGPCPEMQVRAVDGNCWGECVPIGECVCAGPEDCPDENQYTCHNFSGRCGPYL